MVYISCLKIFIKRYKEILCLSTECWNLNNNLVRSRIIIFYKEFQVTYPTCKRNLPLFLLLPIKEKNICQMASSSAYLSEGEYLYLELPVNKSTNC